MGVRDRIYLLVSLTKFEDGHWHLKLAALINFMSKYLFCSVLNDFCLCTLESPLLLELLGE